MKLAHHLLELPFEISSEWVNVLVVEDEKSFYLMCADIYAQINGGEGQFVLSDVDKSVSFSKSCLFLYNYFSFDCSDKKICIGLHKELQELQEKNFPLEFLKINSAILGLFERLNAESEFPIDYSDEIGFLNLLKLYGVCFENDSEGLLSQLVAFIKISTFYLSVKCVFLLNVKSFLSKEEIKELYHEAGLACVPLFLLENCQRDKLDGEIIRIIDKDLCEIVV